MGYVYSCARVLCVLMCVCVQCFYGLPYQQLYYGDEFDDQTYVTTHTKKPKIPPSLSISPLFKPPFGHFTAFRLSYLLFLLLFN